ncbi:hypothetical protein ACFY9N_12560 [Microbacterium sp. NPDC008134]|uniref:hypothetical protein n=1 Tax=Microbacterium sp. NPDC008134 TaxID=3364183 RepID=UPI0036E39771
MLRRPIFWGTALLAVAVVVTLAGDDLSFFPFLLMLVGGWCFGYSFVGSTLRMPARIGMPLHIGAAVVLAALIVVVVEFAGPWLATLPQGARAVLLVLQMAALPAAGWIWLGLISRVTSAIARRDAAKRPAPVPRTWERAANGDGSEVRVRAVQMRMRALTLAIVGMVVPAGLVAFVLMIAFDDLAMRLGPRIVIIALGLLIGLPVYFVFTALARRRAVSCTLAFGDDEFRLAVGAERYVVAYRDLERLLWRARSDYARVEVRAPGVDLSLLVGIVKPPRGVEGGLPAVPKRVFRRLELAGLAVERTRRDDVVVFTRPGTRSPSEPARGARRSASRS